VARWPTGTRRPFGAWKEAFGAGPIPGHSAREPTKIRNADLEANRNGVWGIIFLTPVMTKSRSPGPDLGQRITGRGKNLSWRGVLEKEVLEPIGFRLITYFIFILPLATL
jgi:hypothetical protein